jgi:predicted metal-binding protein
VKLPVAQSPETKPIKPPWKQAAVFVCRECSGNADGNLRKWLKVRLKEDGLKKDVRVVSVGCLDVCPKRRVTVVVAPRQGESKSFVVGIDEREAFYRDLVKQD